MIFSTMLAKIKELIQRMLGLNTTIQQTLNIVPAISNKMAEEIDLWTLMYEDKAPWLHEPTYNDPTTIVSLGLPAFIASEKARMAVLELQSEIVAPTETVEVDNPDYFPPTSDMFGNVVASGKSKTILEERKLSTVERAEFMNKEYHDKLLTKIRTQLEFGIAKGSLIIKPYVVKSKMQSVAGAIQQVDSVELGDKYNIEFDFVQADCFYPFAFDSSGKLTEVAFIQTKVDKESVYTRLEYHKLENNNVHITNRAFENKNTTDINISGQTLGKEISLSDIPEWKDIPKNATIANVDRLLFGYFKMPDANTIDPHSPLGISGFARAKSLIREADKQYSRLLWEYEGGELAIDIDRDALAIYDDPASGSVAGLGHLQKRLYRAIDLGESNTYQPYAPALRDNSLINGLNNILMRIEDVCSLSRGTISDVAAEARTATELKILKQRSYASNSDIQAALETALKDVVYAMDVYCTIYNIVGDVALNDKGFIDTKKLGKYDVSFTWDDSILVDVDSELGKRMTLMQSGLTSKTEVRMWYFGETERQARTALEKIKEDNQEAMEQNMAMASQLGQDVQKAKKEGKQPFQDNPDKEANKAPNDDTEVPPNGKSSPDDEKEE